ncbi:MAG: glycosyltransferase [Pseudomonadota bacterium]
MSAAEQARLKVSQLTLANDYLTAYEYLKGSDLTPDIVPGAWELLWRRVHEAGVSSLSHYVQDDLWNAGIRNSDIAVARARFAVADGRSLDAIDAIEEVFGKEPKETDAAEILAHALVDTDKDRATALLKSNSGSGVKHVLNRVDLYRSLNQFQDALDELDAAEARLPNDPRFLTRRARIAEATGDWETALNIWRGLAANDSSQRAIAQQFIVRLLLKFESTQESVHEFAKLIASDAPAIDKLRGAAVLNQQAVLVEILKAAAKSGFDSVPEPEWEGICRFLMDRGDIGLAAQIANLGLPVGVANLGTLMASSLNQLPPTKGMDAFSSAALIRSPDFQLPFSQAQRGSVRSEYQSATHLNPTPTDQVLIVNATLAAGGAERQIIPLVQSLLANGISEHHIHVAIFSLAEERGHAHFAKNLQELNVRLYDLNNRQLALEALPPTIRSLVSSLPSSLRRDVLALWPVLVQVAPTVLHGWQDRSSVACAYLGALVGISRIVMTARNMKPQDRMIEERHYLPILNLLKEEDNLRLVANSDQGARDYEDWIGLEANSVGVLPNGLDTTPHRPIAQRNIKRQNDTERAITIGGVFRLAANKRPLLWIRTVAAIRDRFERPVKVRLVGTGPYRAQVQEAARDLGLNNIELIPRLSTARELYEAMDCLLLMSRVEGTPNVLLEAQACGLPVMACDVGGVSNCVLTEGPGKGLILPANIEEVDAAQAAASYLSKALYSGAAERHAYIEEHFSLNSLAAQIRDIYGPDACAKLAMRDGPELNFK